MVGEIIGWFDMELPLKLVNNILKGVSIQQPRLLHRRSPATQFVNTFPATQVTQKVSATQVAQKVITLDPSMPKTPINTLKTLEYTSRFFTKYRLCSNIGCWTSPIQQPRLLDFSNVATQVAGQKSPILNTIYQL